MPPRRASRPGWVGRADRSPSATRWPRSRPRRPSSNTRPRWRAPSRGCSPNRAATSPSANRSPSSSHRARRDADDRPRLLAERDGAGPRIAPQPVIERRRDAGTASLRHDSEPAAPTEPSPEPRTGGGCSPARWCASSPREKGISLGTRTGTGPGGRIVRRDLERLPAQAPAPEPQAEPAAPEPKPTPRQAAAEATGFTDVPLTGDAQRHRAAAHREQDHGAALLRQGGLPGRRPHRSCAAR